MIAEKTQLKFAVSKETSELIGFVSRHPKTQKLMGVSEDSRYGKKICLLSEEMKKAPNPIEPDKTYVVELKPMHSNAGYVVISATLKLFPAQVETVIATKSIYQVRVTFGYKTFYFDPKDGNSDSSRTLTGVIKQLREREDLENPESVIDDLTRQAHQLIRRMEKDGYIVPANTLK